jgi:hypothetical protein
MRRKVGSETSSRMIENVFREDGPYDHFPVFHGFGRSSHVDWGMHSAKYSMSEQWIHSAVVAESLKRWFT